MQPSEPKSSYAVKAQDAPHLTRIACCASDTYCMSDMQRACHAPVGPERQAGVLAQVALPGVVHPDAVIQ